jgi:4-hydroxy-tetrahydrodipicolinate synthase
VEIGVPLLERLRARHSNVRWIKEAGGSVDRVDQMKQAMGDAITVLSGDDSLTLAFMASGAEGVISVASNLVPADVARMVHLAQQNDLAGASREHRRLYPLFKALFIEPSPAPIKAALADAGIISSEQVRLPLCEMSPANRAILRKAAAALRRRR